MKAGALFFWALVDDGELALIEDLQHLFQFMAPFEDHAALPDHSKGPLLARQSGPLFDPVDRLFCRVFEHRELSIVAQAVDGIVTPLPRRDHPAIEPQQPL